MKKFKFAATFNHNYSHNRIFRDEMDQIAFRALNT